MIYLGFVLDFLSSFFLPIKTYFVVGNLDKERVLSVIIVGILLDIMYHKIFINLIILLVLYIVLKIVKIGNNYRLVKNIIVYFIYFNVTYWLFGYSSNYMISLGVGFVMQLGYLFLWRELLK